MSEGRLIAGLANACTLLGHFPRAREPAMLRVAVQYLLCLRGVSPWMDGPILLCGSCRWQALMRDCARLPPLNETFGRPREYYRAVYLAPDTAWQNVAGCPAAHTQASFSRLCPCICLGSSVNS